jgi:tryptophanase
MALLSGARRGPRHEFLLKVEFTSEEQFHTEYLTDISEGGLRLHTATPFEVGQDLRVSVSFPRLLDPLEIDTTVRWVHPKGDGFETGVAFRNLSPDTRGKLDALLGQLSHPQHRDEPRTFKVLMLEENSVLQNIYGQELRNLAELHGGVRFEIETVWNIADLQTSLRRSPQLLIVDLDSPGTQPSSVMTSVEGLECCLVLLLGSRDTKTKLDGLTPGNSMYLEKPLQFGLLMRTVSALIRLEHSKQEGDKRPSTPTQELVASPALTRGVTHTDVRLTRLRAAGFNTRNLAPADIDLDLFSDVSLFTALAASAGDMQAREPDLLTELSSLYGGAMFEVTSQGRAAEFLLAGALAERKGGQLTVLTHGMFRTTEESFRAFGAKIEPIPCEQAGASNVDLNRLEDRLRSGGVDAVCLEPSNDSIAGWPLHPDNVQAAGKLCREHGAMLILDVTRLMTNLAALEVRLPDTVRDVCRAADAFTGSCAKEALVASGGFVAVRDYALHQKIGEHAFMRGLLLEPLKARRELARGLSYVSQNPQLFASRPIGLSTLRSKLRNAGVPMIEPPGAHAIFVNVGTLVRADDSHPDVSISTILYARSGVRARVTRVPVFGTSLLRLTWPLRVIPTEEDLDRIVSAVKSLLDRPDDVPLLDLDRVDGPKRSARYRVRQATW